jgi:hypothetical protein
MGGGSAMGQHCHDQLLDDDCILRYPWNAKLRLAPPNSNLSELLIA